MFAVTATDKCGGFTTKTQRECYERTWCRVPDVVEKWTSEGEGSTSGIHVKMKIAHALKVTVTWDVMLTWLWNKDGLLLSLWTNFAALEEIIMKKSVGCSSKALQVLSLRLGWMCATDSTLCCFHLCPTPISGRGEWISPCMCFLSLGRWKITVTLGS